MSVIIPWPETLFGMTWTIIGFMFGRSFGKQLDHTLMEDPFIKNLRPVWQWLMGAILNFFHHFWIGLLLMVYFPDTWLYWVGFGLFIDDIPDVPKRFVKWFSYLIPEG